MKVINARNVHDALPQALVLLDREGINRNSRNGPVRQFPGPVATVYERPWERVLFHSVRDANPFFHLYEALWMLAGRNDVEGPARYAKQMREYSDDGLTLHGAYGFRWQYHFENRDHSPIDQLTKIIDALRANPDDRRQVLQMWDPVQDLGRNGKDLPCNLTATFQFNHGHLDLVVFNRSNDIIWGCYGANAVHFSMLLEYVASAIGAPMGTYTQVSVNWHAYLNVFEKLRPIIDQCTPPFYSVPVSRPPNPYDDGRVFCAPTLCGDQRVMDADIQKVLTAADESFPKFDLPLETEFGRMAFYVLSAHAMVRAGNGDSALTMLENMPRWDWVVAAEEWIQRRKVKR